MLQRSFIYNFYQALISLCVFCVRMKRKLQHFVFAWIYFIYLGQLEIEIDRNYEQMAS